MLNCSCNIDKFQQSIIIVGMEGKTMDNMTNTNFKRKLPVPQEIKKEMPLSKEAEEIKTKRGFCFIYRKT